MRQESFLWSVQDGIRAMPAALRWIILSTVAVFLIQTLGTVIGGAETGRWLTDTFGFKTGAGISLSQPWRLVTYMLLHAGAFHLLFNMLWLWWMGRPVADRIGTRNFMILYIGAGVLGAMANVMTASWLGMDTLRPTVGASGAVFGVMVSFAMLYPTTPIMLLLLPPIEARYLVLGLIAIDLLFLTANDNVARMVHLGGALAGYGLMRAYQNGWFDLAVRLTDSYRPPRSASKPKNRRMRAVTDAVVLEEVDQSEIDRILDKIAKSGYSSLTADEKQRLFNSSKS
jgi:membrane associated rhomboid family serine protease